jgi:putative ABC transport system permease protein
VLGLDPDWRKSFDPLLDQDGNTLEPGDLAEGEVVISTATAEALDVATGDTVHLFFSPQPTVLEVTGVYESGATPAGETSLVLPLARLQSLTGHVGEINSVIITNQGDLIEGEVHTEVVLERLEPLLAGRDLEASPDKQKALAQADDFGNSFSGVFLLFGQFSITAGILLIFLIFVMLAAERKQELGIARAVGTQRGHIIRLFTFEGVLYAFMAATVGSVLGVVVGWGMVRLMAQAFASDEGLFELTYTFNWRSLVLAFTLGMFFTFIVVIVSSWRVSRLNIVAAIRDIPESLVKSKSRRSWILIILLILISFLTSAAGFQSNHAGTFGLGVSLIIIGFALLAWRLGANNRLVFTAAGLLLVIWWLLPAGTVEALDEMDQGIELFFISGIFIVVGAVWTVIYNTDALLTVTLLIFGRLKGMPPVLRAALSYPSQNRFRTAMTLTMFSLVIFTLVVMAFIIHSQVSVYEDTERISGGFDIQADTSFNNPIPDMTAALGNVDGVAADDFVAMGSVSGLPVKLKQAGAEGDSINFLLRGANNDYTEATTFEFVMRASGYDSDEAVWQALQTEPNKAVVSPFLVASRTSIVLGGPEFQLEGFFIEDEEMPEVKLLVQNAYTGVEEQFEVIGVIDRIGFFSSGPVLTSQESLNALAGGPLPAQSFFFGLREGVEAEETAKALEAGFLENGMQAFVLAQVIRDSTRTNMALNNLLQGFMSLGLVVGIAALGVITARAVVERRHQIGVLRAIGFQKGMVQLAFLLESSFVAILGILLGLGLGAAISYNVIGTIAEDVQGLEYTVPWANLIVVVVVAYTASLLTTYLSARQAANIHPAEALRFE